MTVDQFSSPPPSHPAQHKAGQDQKSCLNFGPLTRHLSLNSTFVGADCAAASIFAVHGIEKMVAIRCPQCGVSAYDKASELFGFAHLVVRDGDCSYFVGAKEYVFKCEYVDGRRDDVFCATDNSCPNLKEAITLGWRLVASAQN